MQNTRSKLAQQVVHGKWTANEPQEVESTSPMGGTSLQLQISWNQVKVSSSPSLRLDVS